MYSLVQCLDEELVRLRQDVVGARLAYEAQDEASSYPPAHHGSPHLEKH
jgi:hypothetical protein